MKTAAGPPASAAPPEQPLSGRFWGWPSTPLGWWSIGLGATFVVLFMINATVFMPSTVVVPWRQTILPYYGIFMLLCGLASGIVGLIALVRRRERSWLVWLTVLPALWVLFMVLGEFLVPH